MSNIQSNIYGIVYISQTLIRFCLEESKSIIYFSPYIIQFIIRSVYFALDKSKSIIHYIPYIRQLIRFALDKSKSIVYIIQFIIRSVYFALDKSKPNVLYTVYYILYTIHRLNVNLIVSRAKYINHIV